MSNKLCISDTDIIDFKGISTRKIHYIYCVNSEDKDFYELDPNMQCEGKIEIDQNDFGSINQEIYCNECNRLLLIEEKTEYSYFEFSIKPIEFWKEIINLAKPFGWKSKRIKHYDRILLEKESKKVICYIREFPYLRGSSFLMNHNLLGIIICKDSLQNSFRLNNSYEVGLNQFIMNIDIHLSSSSIAQFDDHLKPIIDKLEHTGSNFEVEFIDIMHRVFQKDNKQKLLLAIMKHPNSFKRYVKIGGSANSDAILYDIGFLLKEMLNEAPGTLEAKGYHPKSTSKVNLDHIHRAEYHTLKLDKSVCCFGTTTMEIAPEVYLNTVTIFVSGKKGIKTYFFDGDALNTILGVIS